MNSPTQLVFSFGVIADIQYADDVPYHNRYYRASLRKTNLAIATFNEWRPDFIINLGDLIDHQWQSYDQVLPLFEQLKAPVYHVLGNHDYEVEEGKKAEVPARIGTRNYYAFSMKEWRIIVLDGNDVSLHAHVPGTTPHEAAAKLLKVLDETGRANANFWNGAIGNKQLTWLDNQLQKASENHEKVLICCHFPIYPAGRHNLLNDLEVRSLISRYDVVKAWCCGHNHDGNYGMLHGIHFINFRSIVETSDEYAFSIVRVYKDFLQVQGFGQEISGTFYYA